MCYNNSQCLNGGTCHEDFPNHSFTCECQSDYGGDYCDRPTGLVSLFIQSVILGLGLGLKPYGKKPEPPSMKVSAMALCDFLQRLSTHFPQ